METRNQSQGYAAGEGRKGLWLKGETQLWYRACETHLGKKRLREDVWYPESTLLVLAELKVSSTLNTYWLKLPVPRVSSKHLLFHEILPC